jgi:proteasome assembly chaperone (PAC2) family protein
MDYVEYTNRPKLRAPVMLIAFAGWPDAGEGATGALKYLSRTLPAAKFASIDPEEFYDFTDNRPVTSTNAEGEREITWPANEFFAYDSGDLNQDLLIFVGVEPNLKWRTFSNVIADVAQEYEVSRVIMLGALLDSVPHTRAIKISGGSTDPELREKLGGMGIRGSGYQGPTGISTTVSQVFLGRQMRFGSIWGHSPHYLEVSEYPKVSLAIIESLQKVLGARFDLEELRETEASFARQFEKALEKEDELITYVQRLEHRYDASAQENEITQTPQEMVRVLEEFLKLRISEEDSEAESQG